MSPRISEAESVLQWLNTPFDERTPLTKTQQELYERWNVADNLMRELMSEKKVVQRLMDKFGYSESTARRDLEKAREAWATRPRADKDYLANLLVDYLTETMVRAGRDRKYGDVARLAKVIQEISGIGKKEEVPDDPLLLSAPVPMLPTHNPELIGGTQLSPAQLRELTDRVLKEKRSKGFIANIDEAEVIPDDGEPGEG